MSERFSFVMRKKKPYTIVPRKQQDLIINYYLEVKNQNTCSKHFNISRDTIKKVLCLNNVPLFNGRIHSFNKDYFKSIDTNEKAYFLGFITGDGSNVGEGLVINLQREDAYILEKFKDSIQYTGDIKYFTPLGCKNGCKEIAKIALYSIEMVQDLNKLGITQRKYYSTYLPSINNSLERHFIRGLFDADGSLSQSKEGKYTFNITGHYDLLKSVQDILIRECKLNTTTLTPDGRTKGNTVNLHYSGNVQVKRIMNYLYEDSDELYLKRKYEKYLGIKTKEEKKVNISHCVICGESSYIKNLCKKHYFKVRNTKQKLKRKQLNYDNSILTFIQREVSSTSD